MLQNKAVRILSGTQYFQIYGQDPGPLPSSEPLYKNLEILKISDIFRLSIANFVFSTLTFDSPAIFNDWFHYDHDVHDHTTRSSSEVIRENYFDVGHVEQSYVLHTKGAKNIYGEKMIQVSGPVIWNSIPDYVRKAESIFTFKKHLKMHFLEHYDIENIDRPYDRPYNSNINNNNNNNNRNNNRNANDNANGNITFRRPFISRWDGGTA